MRPAVVVLGFVLGSAAAITFALVGHDGGVRGAAVRVSAARERARPLLISVGCSALLTVAAGSSFYGEIRRRGWRRGAWLALFVMLAAVAAYHAWPRA